MSLFQKDLQYEDLITTSHRFTQTTIFWYICIISHSMYQIEPPIYFVMYTPILEISYIFKDNPINDHRPRCKVWLWYMVYPCDVETKIFCKHWVNAMAADVLAPCVDIYSNKAVLLVVQDIRVLLYDDVIKWKHFQCHWPFVRGIHRLPVDSPHKSQCRGALIFSLKCARINI